MWLKVVFASEIIWSVANILTSTIAMLNVSTKRPLSDPDSAQDSKKICRCEIGRVMHFATALEQTVNVVVYGEFEAVLEIDKGRNIVYNY